MRVFVKVGVVISCLVLSACSHLGSFYSSQFDSTALEGFEGKTIKISKTIIVKNGETFDGDGNLYQWVGAGDCSQKEGMPPMFVLAENATLKNLWVKNAPDGIHIKGSNVTVENMVNVDVCEDAISIKLTDSKEIPVNIIIKQSKFYDCEDKAIQITRGKYVVIQNNEFYRCARAVRIKEQAQSVLFEGNYVVNAKHVVKATGGDGIVKNNIIKSAVTGIWAEKDSVVIDGGGNQYKAVQDVYHESQGGRVIVR